MNTATKETGLPALIADLLEKGGYLADSLFADLWKQIGMNTLLHKSGFSKRSGTPISDLVYILILWIWLKKDSIAMFAQESLQDFTNAEKDALYSTLNQEDLNWRLLNLKVAIKAVISGALNELEELPGDTINLVMDTIEKHIKCFFTSLTI